MKEDVENKVKSIVGLYNFYKQQMNTAQRIGMLTLWIETSIDREEYEVAAGLQKELDKIINGEEEFYVISPLELQKKQDYVEKTLEILEKNKIEPKKKLKFVSNWNSGSFDLIRFSFKPFKIIFLNLGIELK